MRLNFAARSLLALAGGALLASAAPGAVVLEGLYRLHNHPDGTVNPPPYGARFDELYNATSNHDVFTLDFDHVNSAVYMTVSATQIRIYGQSWGGRDTGSGYANDLYRGVYSFDFTYNIGVQVVPGDDDLWVNGPNHANSGFITGPGSLATRNLVDERDNGFSFRLGDENDDQGHRGFSGISGWGWMSYVTSPGQYHHASNTDWIFTATYEIPSPGAASLAAAGLLVLARRRRTVR